VSSSQSRSRHRLCQGELFRLGADNEADRGLLNTFFSSELTGQSERETKHEERHTSGLQRSLPEALECSPRAWVVILFDKPVWRSFSFSVSTIRATIQQRKTYSEQTSTRNIRGTAGMKAEASCHLQLLWKMRFAHAPRNSPNAELSLETVFMQGVGLAYRQRTATIQGNALDAV
jgi:hypothetical protein